MLKLFSLALFISFCTLVHSSSSYITFSEKDEIFNNIGKQVYFFEDTSNTLSVDQVCTKSELFKPSTFSVLNLGSSTSSFWLRFSVKNTSKHKRLLFQVSNPILDECTLYSWDTLTKSYHSVSMGDLNVFAERKYGYRNLIFDLNSNSDEVHTYYLKIRGTETISVPISIGTQQSIFIFNTNQDLILGIYFGILLVMFLYNIFIYFTVKDSSYLFYVLYILFIGLTQASLLGYSYKYLWPNNHWLIQNGLYMSVSIAGISIILFMRHFLQMKKFTPIENKIGYVIIFLYVAAAVTSLLNQQRISYNIVDVTALLLMIFAIYCGIRISLKGFRPARIFLAAWIVFASGVIVFVLKNFGVLPDNTLTNYTMYFGSGLEVILLSMALADRINILKRETVELQRREYIALQEKEKLVREQNVLLESKVKERTAELEQTNEELNMTLEHLKQTQTQLVSSEKMASLGQLTAGIAHEINNPINFVSSNIKPLRRDIHDVISVLDRYRAAAMTLEAPALSEAEKFYNEMDVKYLSEELEMLVNGIEEGASRTTEIVKGLRNFSRLDEEAIKYASMEEGIESTLILLRNNMEEKGISVIRNYNSVPEIECYPGKLNQVFMNIISNAIHAVHSKDSATKKEISISISHVVDKVQIEITDTGTGMPKNVINRIFEPFYTTKDVGEGTGLGLSIVYSIIESHNGTIKVDSIIGEGTTFTITLPIKQL